MQELIEYKCPSCGASLKIAAGEEFLTCEFCKASFRRELSDSERDTASCKKLTKELRQYKKDLTRHNTLEAAAVKLADEVTELSEKDTSLPSWAAYLIPIHAGCLLICLLLFIAASKADSKAMMTLVGIIYGACVTALIVAGIRKDKLKKNTEIHNRLLKTKLSELTSARNELEKFDQTFDASYLPEKYRNDEALDALIDIFRTGKASRLGDGLRLYDKQLHQSNMQQLSLEQMQIHQKQLEKLEELSDYGFDDTYDDDDFELEETAAAVKASINDTLRTQQMSRELEDYLNDEDDF